MPQKFHREQKFFQCQEDDSDSSSDEDDTEGILKDPRDIEWMVACCNGNLYVLNELFLKSQDVIRRKDYLSLGYTCLHWAAKLGRVDMVEFVVRCHQKAKDDGNDGIYLFRTHFRAYKFSRKLA